MTRVLGKGILSAPILRREEIEIPEWGGSILVRELTEAEATDCQKTLRYKFDHEHTLPDSDSMSGWRKRIWFYGWINEDGTQVLSREDRDKLDQVPYSILDRVAGRIAELSGITPKGDSPDADAAKN